jgi:hypothetical protein
MLSEHQTLIVRVGKGRSGPFPNLHSEGKLSEEICNEKIK